MVHCTFNRRVIRDDVDSQPCALCKSAELVVNGLHLNRVEWDECRLTRALVAHILDAVNRSLLLIDHDCIDIAPEDDSHGGLVLALGGLAQIDDAASNSGKDALEVCECLLQPGFTLRLLLVYTRLCKLFVDLDELLVDLFLESPRTESD